MKESELVADDLWKAVEPFLPTQPPKPNGGRPRVPDRAALAGIVFVLETGIPWWMLPTELGYGSDWTCWRRLRDWQLAGGRRLGEGARAGAELVGGSGRRRLEPREPGQHQRPGQ